MTETLNDTANDPEQTIAELQRKLAERTAERDEALERQTATADILKVIASSPSDVQPVFEAIVKSAAKVFEPCAATITSLKDGRLHWNAIASLQSDFVGDNAKAIYPIPFDPKRSPSARAMLERRIIEIPDTASPDTPEITRRAAAAEGVRSATFVPLISQDKGIGTIILTHPQAGFRLSEKQLSLVQTFADQAVIAIQNTRLFNETKEALEQQTATAEILSVISSSPTDVHPTFEAIATRAAILCEADNAAVFRFDGSLIHMGAMYGVTEAERAASDGVFPLTPGRSSATTRAVQGREVVHIPDTRADPEYTQTLHMFGTALSVPMLREGVPLGAITVTRYHVESFSERQIELVRNFADQAVIAIENTRLLDELRESLAQQQAIAEVLAVINGNPGNLQPVFDAMLERAARLCEADTGHLFRFENGAFFRLASHGVSQDFDRLFPLDTPVPLNPLSIPARMIATRSIVHVWDQREDESYRLASTAMWSPPLTKPGSLRFCSFR